MAREVAITFALNAALKGGYKAAFQGAASQARNVASAVRAMEKSPTGKLGAAMLQSREKIKGISGSLKEARSTLASLNAQAQATGGGTAQLRRQIELATTRVNNLEGAMKRQLGTWRNTTAQAATAGGSIRRLSEDYNRLAARMERARKDSQALNANRAQADALRSQRSTLHSQLLSAAGTAMAVALPAKISIDFEDSIARVGAVARAEGDDLARLTATARQLGRDTVFSASQAAEGMQYLAMAGFNVNETIAAMPGMLDLAAAGNTDLGRTADIASDILSAFKLKAEDMGTVSHTLAKTFTTSNTNLEMLGDTMKYVGPVAATVGLSLQDTSAMAGMLGNVGIKASQAGTVLRAALLRLAAPPKMAKKALGELAGVAGPELDELYEQIGDTAGAEDALKELGMTTKDAAGNLRPVVDILEELNLRTAQMGSGDKAEVFKKVFGSEASAGMMALAEQASVTVDKEGKKIVNSLGEPTNALRAYMAEVNNYGTTASDIAQKMNATTGGALRRLRSAWEDVGISVGNLFLPAISGVADGLTSLGNVISGAVQRFPFLSRAIGITVGALAALFAGSIAFGLVANVVKSGLNGLKGVFLRVAASQVTTTATTTAAGGAFTVAGGAARFFAGGLRSILTATGVGAALVLLGYAITALIDNWDAVVAAMSAAWGWVTTTWGKLGTFFTELGNNLAAIFPGIAQGITGAFQWAKDTVVGIWEGITDFFSGIWEGITGGASSMWDSVTGWAGEAFDGVTSIWEGATGFFTGIVDSITGVFETFFSWLRENFSWIFNAIDAVGSTLSKIGGAISSAWDKAFGDDDAPAEAAKKSAPAAAKAQEEAAAKAAAKAPPAPRFTPVSASAVKGTAGGGAARVAGKSGSKGRHAGSGAGSGARSTGGAGAGSSSSSGGGPVTVVSLAGDNAAPQTIFFPASGSGAAMPAAAAAQASQISRALPKAPELAKEVMRGAGKASPTSGGAVTVDLTQHFDLIAGDARAVRKVLESIKPDMEALVRRALEKLQSDRSRTAYAQ